MKITAMQELLDDIEKHIKVDWPMNKSIRNSITKALEKEKEKMLDFGLYVKKNGWVGCKIEDLYEDYYNQNK